MSDPSPDVTDAAPRGYWPDDPPAARRPLDYDCPPFVIPIRHLPTEAEIRLGLMAGGEAALPLLDRWAALVSVAVGDVKAFSESLGPRLSDGSGTGEAERAADTLSHMSRRIAAEVAASLERRGREPIPRPSGLHVLEDATYLVEMADAGTDFALVGHPFGLSPAVISGSPGSPPRLLDPSGPPDDQERHAGAVRMVRSLVERVLPYWESAAFQRLAGRRMAVARGTVHLGAILGDMAAQGHGKAFLKHAMSKRGTWVADIAGGGDIDAMSLRAHAAMGHSYADLHRAFPEAIRNVLVQEFTPFTHEHRFLVVNHRIVASTPSDRSLGILDRVPGRRLRPGVARLRRPADGEGAYDRGPSDTVGNRGLLARMARMARTCAAAFRREGFLPHSYCLDVGLCERGVVPIEVNTLHYCGVYAADWGRVARALARLPSPVGRPDPSSGLAPDGRTDKVEGAFDFMLDILSDEPPRALAEVAARLAALATADEIRTARALGVVARDASNRELAEDPPSPALVAEARAHLGHPPA